MDLEPRTLAPAHATGAVEFVPIDAVVGDPSFKLRDEGDVSTLASSIGRLGQLVPIEIRPMPGAPIVDEAPTQWQVVSGFRRVAALRLLHRDRVLARIHRDLSDEDAWGVALGQALLTEPLLEHDLEALRKRILEANQATWAYDLVDEALVRAPVAPEHRERLLEFLGRAPSAPDAPQSAEPPAGLEAPAEDHAPTIPDTQSAQEAQEGPLEVTPEELTHDLTVRLYELNEDLLTAYDAWGDLPAGGRLRVLEQMRYIAHLLELLEAKG